MTEENLYDGPTKQVFPITWQCQLVFGTFVRVLEQRVFQSDQAEQMAVWAEGLRATNPQGEFRIVTPHDEGFVGET